MAPRERASRPGRRSRLLGFVIAIALQAWLSRRWPGGPALIALAGVPRGLTPGGAPATVAAAATSAALLGIPPRIALRGGTLGLAMRAALLSLSFDAWSTARSAEAVADALERDDLVAARAALQRMGAEPLPPAVTAQEIADRAEESLAGGAADHTVGPWLAYALFDLPGAVAYHLPALLARLWGDVPAIVLRAPLLGRAIGAGPRLVLLRGLSARATGIAYGAAAPAVGGDAVRAVRAALAADTPALAAATVAAGPPVEPAAGLRRALRLHRAALAVAAAATALIILAGPRPGRGAA